MDHQDPQKPGKGVEMGVPVDKPFADAPMGVPVAAPGYYGGLPPAQPYAAVDAYGRPIVNAVPTAPVVVPNNANIQRDVQGSALCRKCHAPYPLPAGATSWRCRQCHEFNNASIYGDECCVIL